MLKRTKGEGRQPETAGMNTTSSKTNNNDSKDKTFHQDGAEKKPPLMGQKNSPEVVVQSSFGQVDLSQNISPQFSNDSFFSNDSLQFSNRFSSAISSSLNSREEVSRGVDWDQEVESVFMEEIDKMRKQME